MESFVNLKVWKKAHELVLLVYKLTKKFPSDERFGLVSQMCRAAVSVPANIAEGNKRKSAKDKKHFQIIAEGSLEELKYYLYLSYDLKYIKQEEGKKAMELAREVGRMLHGLKNSIK
jgi:four helix bundle protein